MSGLPPCVAAADGRLCQVERRGAIRGCDLSPPCPGAPLTAAESPAFVGYVDVWEEMRDAWVVPTFMDSLDSIRWRHQLGCQR